jgi:8-oxo-dGTP diphosphatase
MAERAAAIIISKRHILLIHRIRTGQDYYVFPGGRIEEGESAEQACVREVLEETGLNIAWLQPAFDHALPTRMAHYFFVQVHPGTMTLGGPEVEKQSSDNRYVHEWVLLSRLGGINLHPAAVRDAIVRVIAEDGPVREAHDLALRRDRMVEMLSQNGL